jgi:transposase-like protein
VNLIAAKIGWTQQSLNEWVKKATVDSGRRVGISIEMSKTMYAQESERRQLHRKGFCSPPHGRDVDEKQE